MKEDKIKKLELTYQNEIEKIRERISNKIKREYDNSDTETEETEDDDDSDTEEPGKYFM